MRRRTSFCHTGVPPGTLHNSGTAKKGRLLMITLGPPFHLATPLPPPGISSQPHPEGKPCALARNEYYLVLHSCKHVLIARIFRLHLVDLAKSRSRASEHEGGTKGDLVGPVHQEPPEDAVSGIAVLGHADQR